ncbi:MAG: ketopantoate reductase family protein [Caldilineaceae bacterium]|nr:ketopantoate reductase family protein [Caldilineaceae bacterium]
MWNVLIIGAGAIGCLVGAKLAQANQRVTLVGRSAFVEQVRARGLQLTDERGAHTVRNVHVAATMLEAYHRSESAFDLAIFTVKSYDTAAAVAELQQALADAGAPRPALLSLQNGVGNEEMLAQISPRALVIAGSITTPVSVIAPGAIRIDKPRYGLGLALWEEQATVDGQEQGTGAASASLFDDLYELLAMAGFAVKSYRSAASLKWTKLLMNMLGNATCAILDEAPESVFADRRMLDIEIKAWREALAVMRAAHIAPVDLERYPFGKLAPLIRYAPAALLRSVLHKQIRGARGGKMPSLHIDLHSNKGKSEVRWLNGAVADKGAMVGVAAPVNAQLTEILLQLVEQPAERKGWKNAHDRLWQALA